MKPGKGPAFVRTKLKSVTSGKVVDNTFSAGHKIDDIRVETSKFQYLYGEGENYNFMNIDDYNQIVVSKNSIDNPELMKEGDCQHFYQYRRWFTAFCRYVCQCNIGSNSH